MRTRRRVGIGALATVCVLALAPGASAAVFQVTNTADAGAGSLRQAIIDANGAAGSDSITITATGTVDLVTGLPIITEPLDISGPGSGQFAVNGGNAVRPFDIDNVAVTMSGLTVRNGRGILFGGGIQATGVDVSLGLRDCVFTENKAVGNPLTLPEAFAHGGAIFSNGLVTIRDCTFSGNQALAAAGVPGGTDTSAGAFGGAIESPEEGIDAERVTFSGNSAVVTNGDEVLDAQGGALRIIDSRLVNTTITGNTASVTPEGGTPTVRVEGGGIRDSAFTTLESVTLADNTATTTIGTPLGANLFVNGIIGPSSLQNTIVADPKGAANCSVFTPGSLTSLGNNLLSDSSCVTALASDVVGADPQLKPLADNGGKTQTRALPLDSPAVDQGASAGLNDDQRGQPRPSQNAKPDNPAGGDGADIGAYELQVPDTILKKKPLIKRPKKSILRFKSTIPDSTFTCSLDGGKNKSCKKPQNYRFLPKGKHRFSVFATSPEGIDDPTPAETTWFVRKGPRPPGK